MTSPAAPDAVLDRLRQLCAEQLGVDPREARADALLVEDLGVDSLALTELAMTLEDELSVALPDEALAQLQTLADLETLVRTAAG